MEEQEECKTVVVVYGDRWRPVQFKSGSTPKEEVDNLYEVVTDCFRDIWLLWESKMAS